LEEEECRRVKMMDREDGEGMERGVTGEEEEGGREGEGD